MFNFFYDYNILNVRKFLKNGNVVSKFNELIQYKTELLLLDHLFNNFFF